MPDAGKRSMYTHIDTGLYEKRRMHEYEVMKQYDAANKREFFAQVMGDGTGGDIHFGKWDGIDPLAEGAYSQASVQLTQWMWAKAMVKIEDRGEAAINYLDLGAGYGSSAHLICQSEPLVHATCINIAPTQNRVNMSRAARLGLSGRVSVKEGSFMDMPFFESDSFDGCFSQDVLMHAYSKEQALGEALRVTRPGGFLVLCDLQGPGTSEGSTGQANDMLLFNTDIVHDLYSSSQLVQAAQAAGWAEVETFDLSHDLRSSLLELGRRVTEMLESGRYREHAMEPLLKRFAENLYANVDHVERGIMSWSVFIARKPRSCNSS